MRQMGLINALGLSMLAPCLLLAQSGQPLSITNYQFVSEQPISTTQSYVTYRADLVNIGKPEASVMAVATSLNPSSFTVVSGQETLNFAPVPGNGQVTSSNTFTLRVNRAVPFDFANVQWTFQITPLPPVANAGPNQTAKVGDTVTLDGTGSTNPSGVGTLTYSWAFTYRPGGSAKLNNPTSVMPTFTLDVPGNFIITLTVNNGLASSSASVTVSTINSPPVANPGPNQTVALHATVVLDGSHSSDVDGDPLTYQWSFVALPAGSTATLTGANTVSPIFIADRPGTYRVQLVVSDPTSSSPPAIVVISTQNTAPVAKAGANQLVSVGAVVQLDGSGSTDADGDSLTYHWSLPGMPAGSAASLSNPSAVSPTFKADLPGTYVAQLIVNDGQADSLPSTVTITTNVILPPTANAGANQTVHGGQVNLSGSGTDPQGLALTYQWALPGKPPGSLATVTVSPTDPRKATFSVDLLGTYTAQLVVNNGYLNSAPSTVTITDTNTLPVANAGPNQNGAVGSVTQPDGSGSTDADHDPLTYSWSFLNRPAGSFAQLSSTTSVSPSFTPDVVGPYVLQLIVNDGYGNSAPSTVTITVVASVTITTQSLAKGVVGTSYSQTLSATGGLGPYTWQLTSGTLPAGLTLNGSTGQIGGTPTAVANATPLTFKVTDSASFAQTATVNLTLTIAPLLTITTTALSNGVVGTAYSQTLTATGGTGAVTWQLTSGTLPDGLTLNASSGLISGTPTATASATPLTFKATDSGTPAQSATVNLALTIAPLLTITTTALSNGVVGTAYSQTLAANGGTGALTWQLTSGTLPAGLTLNGSTGLINGTPTATASATPLTFKVTDSGTPAAQTATADLTLTIAPLLTITTTALSNGAVGTAYSQTLAATGGTGAVTWQLTSGTLPDGLTLNASSGLISGTSTAAASAIPLGFKVTDSGSPAQTATANLNLTVTPAPLAITTLSLPDGMATVPYSATLAATGGTTPYVWSVQTGRLPPGLSLDSSSGIISGTASVTSSSYSVYKVTDSSSPPQTATVGLSLTIGPPVLTITTASLPNGLVGSPYSQALAAGGGITPLTWSLVSGSMPAGLTLYGSTGLISGTPAAPVSNSKLVIQATDSSAPVQTATKTLYITIAPSQLSITTASLPNGTVGTSYSQTLAATGGTPSYSWQLTSGTLPAGLTLNASTGQISGTPTAAVSTTPLGFKVTDSGSPTPQTATVNLALTIVSSGLTITTTSLPNGAVAAAYSQTLAATGGTTPYSWQLTTGTLPAGLTLNASTGLISGTPTATASATSLTFKVSDSSSPVQTATATLALTIAPQLVITTASLPNGAVGTAYSQTLAATGGTTPFSWQLTSGTLPAGLTLNASSGLIGGTPTAAASATPLTFKVTDAGLPVQNATVNLTLTIAAQLVITTTSLPNGTQGSAYSQMLAATGGTTPYSWQLTSGTLPGGLTLNASTGLISGTPTAAANATPLTFKVTDSGSPVQNASVSLTLTITGPPLTITTTSLPAVVIGVPYSATLSATGGTLPYTWSISAGRLTGALTLDASTGVISGTIQAPDPSTVTFKVTDASSPAQTATVTLTINVINGQLAIATSSPLPSGQVGVPYSQTMAATGGTSPYTWQVVSGTLPSDLTLNGNTGLISGTPTVAVANARVIIRVTDSASPANTASASFYITILSGPPTISTTSLAPGQVGVAYSQTLSVTGGTAPYAWQLTAGTLPAGLTLNGSTGQIGGTPTAAATATPLTFKVTDSSTPAQSATATLSLTIVSQLTITTTSLPNGAVGTAYSQALAATGGTGAVTWQLTSGTLPAGLTLNASGLISGTPTAVVTATPLTFKATDSGTPVQTATVSLTLTIAQLTITTASLPNGIVGTPYSQTLAVTGGIGAVTWQLTSGTLPAGLTLNASGLINGTPTAVASATPLTFKATDSGSPAQATVNLTLTIVPVLTITTTSLPNGAVGTAYSQALAATGGTGAVTWQLTSGTLPAGLTVNASGLISGTPTATASATPLTFKATDSGSPAQTATVNLTLTIASGLTITTTSLPNGVVGTPYSQTLAATGGTGAVTWQLTSGTLPAGLTMNASGLISGTPTAVATATPLTFKATDSSSPAQTATVNLTLTIASVFTITTTSLPNGAVGTAYSQTLAATGGTASYTWQLTSGTLPAGLTVNASGLISGTPTAVASATPLTFKATDSGSPAQTATANLTLTIAQLTITTTSLLNGVVGTAYSQPLAATGATGAVTWQLTSGTLPAGLTFNASGLINGTPTAAASATPLTFKATDSASPAQATAALTLTIVSQLTITPASLPNGVVNTPYSQTLSATGGTSPYSWQLTSGTLPAGLTLTLSGSTAVISGTPTATASATPLTFKVTDSGPPVQTATPTLTLTILPPGLQITTSALVNGAVGAAYSYTLVATGGTTTYSWQLTSGTLPAGLTLHASTGVIDGTPTGTANAIPLTFKVTDSSTPAQTATATLTLTIQPQLVITTTSLLNGAVGTPYSQPLAATGGAGAYTWHLTSGTLPAGLTLNASTGSVSGTPSAAASATPLTFSVTDGGPPSQTAAASFTLTIASQLTITTTSLPNGAVGTAYSQTLAATGGTPSYSWQMTSGTLPAGLTVNAAGQISGTPTAVASATPLTFKATDSGSPAQTATVSLTLTIASQLTITTTSLPNGVVGTAYSQTLAATGGTPSYSWQLTSGTLPAGLTVNAAGQISGTPTAVASATPLTFKATDSGSPAQTATANLTLTIASVLTITTASLPNGLVGTSYSQTLASTGGTGAVTWQLTAGTLPAGLTLHASTGVIDGTPTAAASVTPLTFKATDSASPAQTATVSPTLTILPVLTITTTSLPNGAVGTLYSQTLAATGGTPSYSWQLTSGTLPAGLTLNPSSGLISGTPTATASATPLTLKVTDPGLPVQTATVSLTLTIVSQLTITTTSPLPNGVVGTPYSQTLAATGGTPSYTWQLTFGTLPAGLTMNASGLINGTPTAAASATPLTFKATDSGSPAQTATVNLTLTIVSQLTITTASLPNGAVGTAYSQTLAATGGTPSYSWQLTSGTLPAGLTVNAAGLINGTPTATASATPLTFKATDSGSPAQTATVSVTLTIVSQLTITTASLPNGAVGTAYSQTLAATGGTPSYSWQLTSGTLPAGLTMNASGLISGTPTAAASATPLTFKVTDSGSPAQTATVNLTLTITAPAPTITTTVLPDGVAGAGYSFTMAATGGTPPYSWSAPSGWPSGLSALAITSSGQIQGTPGAPNTYSVTLKVTDANSQSASATLSLLIARSLSIITASIPNGTVGVQYTSTTIATNGGKLPLTWSATGLPAGLTIDSSGTISGTPGASSLYTNTVTVTATDSLSPTPQTATATYTPVLIVGGVTGGTISVSSISLGQDLQDLVTISLATPAGPSGLPITITSGDPNKLLLSTSSGPASQLVTTIGAGQTSISVLVQARASSGTVTLTAASVGSSGQGTITLTPSGFVLFAGPTPGGSFNTTQGATTVLTVSSAQLDSSYNFVMIQPVRVGLSVTVPLTLSSPGIATLTPASAAFTGGSVNVSINFQAASTGNLNPASTMITAGAPSGSNFVTPNGSPNILVASVAGAGMTACNTTVGKSLEALCNIQVIGSVANLVSLMLTSNSPNLLLSNTPNGIGQSQITVTVAAGHSLSSDFYVYGLTDTGSATYSASGGTLGTVTGTITFAPSGFAICGPYCGYNFTTTTTAGVGVGIYPVLLTAAGDVVGSQNVAGNSSITVNTTSTPIPPAVTVGALNPSQVVIYGGTSSGSTLFQPAGDVGSTTLAVVQPTGFTAPNQYTTVIATVNQPGIYVSTPGLVGYHLQVQAQITLGAQATAGQQLTVTSNDPTKLLLSTDPTQAGQDHVTITLSALQQNAVFNLYGLASSGNPGFTVTSPGFNSFSGSIQLAPSAVVIGVGDNFSPTLTTTVAAGSTPLTVATIVLNNGNYAGLEGVAGGILVQVGLNDSNPAIGTIDQQLVTIPSSGSVNVTFTPLIPGSTTVNIVSVPANIGVYPGFGSVAITVN